MSLFRLFTAKPSEPDPVSYVVLDTAVRQVFEMTKEYCETGEAEGWLRCTGYNYLNGVMRITYLYVER